MSPGPLRRITAAIALLALAPIAAMLLTSAITPQEAAARAIMVVAVVLLVGNLVRIIITQLLHRVERDLPDEVEAEPSQPGAAREAAGGAPARPATRGGAGGAVGATGSAAAGAAGSAGIGADGTPRRRAEDQVDAGRR